MLTQNRNRHSQLPKLKCQSNDHTDASFVLVFFNYLLLVFYSLPLNDQHRECSFNFVSKVLVTDPEKLEAIRARELDITKERLQKILATGVNVILCSGGIDDLCLKYFVEAGAMGVRRCKKADLKRIAKATGAAYLTSLTNMEGRREI